MLQLSPPLGHGAGMVAGGDILLIAAVVFFIQNNHAQIGQGGRKKWSPDRVPTITMGAIILQGFAARCHMPFAVR